MSDIHDTFIDHVKKNHPELYQQHLNQNGTVRLYDLLVAWHGITDKEWWWRDPENGSCQHGNQIFCRACTSNEVRDE